MFRDRKVADRSFRTADGGIPDACSTEFSVKKLPAALAWASRRMLSRPVLILAAVIISIPVWRYHLQGGFWSRLWSNDDNGRRLVMNREDRASSIPDVRVTPVQRKGGFVLRPSLVPPAALQSGGPGKDGIPALSNPRFIPGATARYLSPTDRVIGVVVGSDARAYPINILTHHEIVNDRVANVPVAVTYCPLCDSAVVFDRRTPLGEREFGVSGLLYNSNVVMYDRRGRPESLWSQMATGGISGPGAGKPLDTLPLELTTWKDWLTRYPRTTVLSPKTGFGKDYARNPYARYFRRPQLMFPVQPVSNALPAKTPVLGVWTADAARAYTVAAFANGPNTIEDSVGDRDVTVEFNQAGNTLRVTDAEEGVNWMYSFWFAWYAFRPHTDMYQPRTDN